MKRESLSDHGGAATASVSHMTATSPPVQNDAPATSSPLLEQPLGVEGRRRSDLQCPSREETPSPATLQVAPTPPSSRSATHGKACNLRIGSEEHSGAAAARTAVTTDCTLTHLNTSPLPGSVPQVQELPHQDMNGDLGDGGKQCNPPATTAVEALNSSNITPASSLPAPAAAGEVLPLTSPGASTTLLSRLRNHLAHAHGRSGGSSLVATGGDTSCAVGNHHGRTPSSSRVPKRLGGAKRGVGRDLNSTAATQRLPQLQSMPATPPASVERVVVATSGAATATTPNTPWITQTLSHSQSNIDLTTATTGGALKPVERILADGCAKVGDSPNPSFVELSRTSSPPGLTSDLVPEVAAACHGFLLHLPGVWARPIIRAVTLQTATLHVPQRLLRAPVLFDAYAELKGEVPATLDAAAGKTTASRAVQLKSSHSTGAAPLLLQSVDLQHLLTVAPAILRYRFQDTCRIKVGEVRTGFRSNAQTASRTEASINRYAYVPHVQRDVHFGAILAQCVMRKMSPGPRLLSPGNDLGACPSHHAGEGIPRDAVQHHPPTATTVANNAQRDQRNTSLHPLTITYSAVSFEGLPSIFLKDRYDVARSENVAAGPSSAAQGGAADNSNPRHGGRRRRYIKPFFEREFVATLGSGQEDAAFFATTLAPEFMVGLPSFLKHPERAVPLSIAASLHHLYTALSVELFTRMYVGMPKHTTEAMGSDRCGGSTSAKAASGSALSTSLSPLLPPVSPTCERGGTPGLAAVAPNIHPSEPTAPSPPLRGPALELGMTYVRNTVLCSASTPGMESYIIFLHQLVYTERQGGINSTSGRKDTDRPLRRPPPSPCRAVLQLSEEANGNMSPPAMPVSAAANDGNPPPGTFTLPTIKRAAVELTQLVTWIQDEHSHNPQHGQPFLCNLTFVSTYIPNIAIPTPTSLCQPLPVMELEDSNAFPCAVVLATLDLWKALPPPAVSNLLRVCFVLDRHAQRVMELESPDYATKETPMSTAAAAEAGATDSGIPNSHGASAAVTSAIPFPDPRLRQHVATTIAGQIRTYLEGLPIFDRDDKSHRAHHHHHHHHHHQQQQQQRLLGFFMARLHYYESLNEHHCKTEKVLQHEVLQRMADKHANVSAPSTMSSPNYDVYNVKTKSICDALAAALAVEAAVNTHNNHLGRAGFGGGGVAATAPGSCWLRTASQQVHNISVSDTLDASNLDDDIAAVAKEVTASVVVLLVPQRDVQRR